MLDYDQMTAAIGAARDQVLALMLEHERDTHNGEPCWPNRASAIAHLAHCLGVRGEVWDYAKTLLAEYDANCVDQSCPHGNFPP